ncbi:MAG: hypothetical protein QGG73_03485, partial [Candidatus Hydrogenedentes bacterium]|nr:hypothetical protein [Candidatus Hydrogenedentota bacterium]
MKMQAEQEVTRAYEEKRLGDLYECFLSDVQEALNETTWILVSRESLHAPPILARKYLCDSGLGARQMEVL